MRAQWRASIGAGPDDFVLLHHGRVSWHAKAHHWPMLAALGRVSAGMAPGRRLHLLVAGWSSNEGQEAALRAQAAAICPNVTLHRAGGLQPERRPGIWAAADAFTLLADNIQETFGLAVVEAMAAGLPVLVSDWDGFRDTVRDGQDGFRIPSLMAAPGAAPDLAMAHGAGAMDYDHFLAATTQLVAIDIAATTAALEKLVLDAPARRAMGGAAQARARGEFDWARIIPRWQALWTELRAVREHATDTPPRPWPRGRGPGPGPSHAGDQDSAKKAEAGAAARPMRRKLRGGLGAGAGGGRGVGGAGRKFTPLEIVKRILAHRRKRPETATDRKCK
jgi:glycosyltransferase involved in cell wall biosynthesis